MSVSRFGVNGFCRLRKAGIGKTEYVSSSTINNLPIDTVCGGFLENGARTNVFFSEEHPLRIGVAFIP